MSAAPSKPDRLRNVASRDGPGDGGGASEKRPRTAADGPAGVSLIAAHAAAPTWLQWMKDEMRFDWLRIRWLITFFGSLFEGPTSTPKFGAFCFAIRTPVPDRCECLLRLLFDHGLAPEASVPADPGSTACTASTASTAAVFVRDDRDCPFALSGMVRHLSDGGEPLLSPPHICVLRGGTTQSDLQTMLSGWEMMIPVKNQRAKHIQWKARVVLVLDAADAIDWDDLIGRTVVFQVPSVDILSCAAKAQTLRDEAVAFVRLCRDFHAAQDCDPQSGVFRRVPWRLGPLQDVARQVLEAGTGLLAPIVESIVLPFLDDREPQPDRWRTPSEQRAQQRREERRAERLAREARGCVGQDERQTIYVGNHLTGELDLAVCTIVAPGDNEWRSMQYYAKVVPRADFGDVEFVPSTKGGYHAEALLPAHRFVPIAECARVLIGGRRDLAELFQAPRALTVFRML